MYTYAPAPPERRYMMAEPQFVNGKVIGTLDKGVFFQRIQTRHIFRQMQAKGIDLQLFRSLRGRCREWKLEFEDSKRLICIAYDRIEQSGVIKWVPGAGQQMMVELRLFDEIRPGTQKRLI